MKHSLGLPFYWLPLTMSCTAIGVAQNIAGLSPFQWDRSVQETSPLEMLGIAVYLILASLIIRPWLNFVDEPLHTPMRFVISIASSAATATAVLCLTLSLSVGGQPLFWSIQAIGFGATTFAVIRCQ